MFTFKEIIDMVLNRIDEDVDDADPQILSVVKTGINQAYLLLSSKTDKQTKEFTFSHSSPVKLPSDFVEQINLSNSVYGDLALNDYEILADLLYIRSTGVKGGENTLTYVFYPNRLVNDNDIVNVKPVFAFALSTYASYLYMVQKRRNETAMILMREFQSFLGDEFKVIE